jgi:SHS2 domain-containing protein
VVSSFWISFGNSDDLFWLYFTVFNLFLDADHRKKLLPPEYNRIMGFEEISHTADWSVRVWAQDLPSLFVESARAMNSLSGTGISSGPRVQRTFEAEGRDTESLLVAFLSELVYCQEQENLAFNRFRIDVKGKKLNVEMEGAQIASIDKAIKAVTFHNLQIKETELGFETTIVFDV